MSFYKINVNLKRKRSDDKETLEISINLGRYGLTSPNQIKEEHVLDTMKRYNWDKTYDLVSFEIWPQSGRERKK